MEIRLSNGIIISSEDVEKAEYYGEGAFEGSGCNIRRVVNTQLPFLFIQLTELTVRILGHDAERDVKLLEDASVRIIQL